MSDVMDRIRSTRQGFQAQPVEVKEAEETHQPATSSLSQEPASEFAQMLHLEGGEGVIMYFPKKIDFDVGDVLYLRERHSDESGLIVQAFEKGTASYPQADSKALFRLMTAVSAYQIERTHHEPPEAIDEFMALHFKVRAAIVNGSWSAPEGRVVTRNVDIFKISPQLLIKNVVQTVPGLSLNLHLGDYQGEPLKVAGKGFDKINLVTGMKGSGKSHITKGIIAESLKAGISSVVFDINNEYGKLTSNTVVLHPGFGGNLKFRLDRMKTNTFLDLLDQTARLSEKAGVIANSEIPLLIDTRLANKKVPDIAYLRGAANQIFSGSSEAVKAMRDAYTRSLDALEKRNLIMTEKEVADEDAAIAKGQAAKVFSLKTAFNNTLSGSQVIVFQIGGLHPVIQKAIVTLVWDHLIEMCDLQTNACTSNPQKHPYPIYPTVLFDNGSGRIKRR